MRTHPNEDLSPCLETGTTTNSYQFLSISSLVYSDFGSSFNPDVTISQPTLKKYEDNPRVPAALCVFRNAILKNFANSYQELVST